ncbi:MAG: hypothetical protein Q7S56_00995 [Nanoarchaeota archaeon]|nr:hypothetical protein [Nanoarchaeota archaeon]
MKVQKYFSFLFIMALFILSIFSFSLVSAASYYSYSFDQAKPYVEFVFGSVDGYGGNFSEGEILFVKVLVFLLLFALINFSLIRTNLFSSNNSARVVVGLIVALIAVRYMTTSALINFIWLPYGVLGVVLASVLPFIIFFFFVESFDSSTIRKVCWIAFIVIYFALAYLRWDDFAATGVNGFNLAWLYVIIAFLSLLIMFFDGTIRRMFVLSSIKSGMDTKSILLREDLKRELDRVNTALASSHLSGRDASRLKEEKKRIERAIKRIS